MFIAAFSFFVVALVTVDCVLNTLEITVLVTVMRQEDDETVSEGDEKEFEMMTKSAV